jgi:hypothetical protein
LAATMLKVVFTKLGSMTSRTGRTTALKQERNALEGWTRSRPVVLAAIGGDPERFEHPTALGRTLTAHSAGSGCSAALVVAFRPRAASHRQMT